ncbi:cysteinyl-tRNA synthetase [Entomophthora muscae]|uniref:Cysteinyl-tRNA synthetase n=2 Tax=Entomophthora muscae TaxID=34485 RepID=A0ACC2RMH3_9FUNG|nr:cysteinyl-tRNA synthetase [Entomophthora muscae]
MANHLGKKEFPKPKGTSRDPSKPNQLDDRFIFDMKKGANSNPGPGGTPLLNRDLSASNSTPLNPETPDISNQFIESMVHLGYFDDTLVNPKETDNASIRSMPAIYKAKKRNLFGFNLKNKKRYEDEKSGDKGGRYFGDSHKGSSTEGIFDIDLNFNPQDMDGIVDPSLSVAPLQDEDAVDYELPTVQIGSNNQAHQSWRPPESWNSRRKPSISTEDDRSLEKQLSIDSDQMYFMRIFRKNETFVTIPCKLNDRVKDICQLLAKKLHIQDPSKFGLYIQKLGKGERMLYSLEKPVKIMVRLLTSVGYLADELMDMIREDNSYLCQFVYREAEMSTLVTGNEVLPKGEIEPVVMRAQNLETVPVSLYRFADRIKFLDLSGNLLLDFPLDFAQLCITLSTLKLCHNEYQQIPASLCSLKSLRVLDLSNNWLSQLNSGQLHLLGDLDHLTLCNNQIRSIPDDYAILCRLTALDLSNNCLEVFPLPVCNMPQLRHLNLSYNQLRDIPSLFGELSSLETLVLVNNQLQGELPACFENLTGLTTLDVRKNQLTGISVVNSMPNLEVLRCDQNLLSSAAFGTNHFLRLTLSRTPLVEFSAQFLPNLTELNLADCSIQKLDDSVFEKTPNLVALKLSNNQLGSLPKLSPSHLSRLEVFQCANNRLEVLPEELFSMPRLLQIDIHNNRIKKLPASIWSSLSLYFFNASSNALAAFPTPPNPAPSVNGSGAHLPVKPRFSSLSLALKLRHLILADNRLTEDVFAPISYLTQLHVLNLSCNDIYEVPAGGLYNLVNLTELYLSSNQIATYPAEELERLRPLKVLYINANRLPSLPAELRKLAKLVVLDVGCNQLNYNVTNWNYEWNWNCNRDLRYLNLSGNRRLKILNAGLNTGQSKSSQLSDFKDLPHLKLLGLIDIDVVDTPLEQTTNRRVRTYASIINQVGFGVADRLDRSEGLCSWDFVVPSFRELEDESLFGIFDLLPCKRETKAKAGRVGKYLSDWTTFHLTSELRKFEKAEISDAIPRALRCTFLDLQREAVATYGHDQCEAASVVIAYRKGFTVYMAHIGDALATVSRKGKVQFASAPHIPIAAQTNDEINRVRDVGGFITSDGRVNGETKLSRCFGLFHQLPAINANPSIEVLELTEHDELVILASRALWEVMSHQTAIDIARTEMDNAMLAAQKLRDLAIAYGAEGSILVMVIGVGDLFNRRLQLERRMTRSRNPRFNSAIFDNMSGPADERRLMQYGNWKKIRNHTNPLSSLPVPPPVGQVVIVFTGIKNTTFLWENHPDDMALASRIHDNILRSMLKQVEGYEVKNEGDTFMASFDSVTSAVLWCCLVQLELLQAEWPPIILSLPDGQERFDCEGNGQILYRGLSVRMGMNYGMPLCEEDPMTGRMDYFGPMVNKAARVCGEAKFGEVCISSDVLAELMNIEGLFDFEAEPSSQQPLSKSEAKDTFVIQELRKLGLRLVDIGERKLKGVELPEPLVLVFPKALASRARPDCTLPPAEPTPKGPTLLDHVRTLGLLCIRLETAVHMLTCEDPASATTLEVLNRHMISSITASTPSRELLKIVDIVCSRIENATSTLSLSQVSPDISSVLSAITDYLTAHHSLTAQSSSRNPPLKS